MSTAPILRVGKIKATGRTTPASVDGHLSRTRPTHNADPDRTPLNRWLAGGPGELAASVDAKLARAGLDRSKLRRDATLANDVLLSASPTWFRPDAPDAAGTWDPERLAAFEQEATAFLREQFGGRLVAAVLHLDEATPHVQAVLVPLHRKPDGGFRLSGKDLFSPSSLRDLQEAWERRLAPHGVGPRVKGSAAKHTTLKAFYGAVGASPRPPSLHPAPPPPAGLLEGSRARQERLGAWQKGEARKAARRIKPLAAAAAKGALYEAEQRANVHLRSLLNQEAAISARLREEVAHLRERQQLDQAEVKRLRGVPLHAVALALGYVGEIGRRENAVDLVKRVGGLDYRDALAWLSNAFGPDAAAAAAGEQVRAAMADAPPALTKAERVKARAIAAQLDALGAPAYRVTVMRQVEGEKVGQNLGKGEEGESERFFTRDEVLAMLPRLTAANVRGGNVFVTPIDDAAHHALIDDLKGEDMARLRAAGYAPALVLETSPGNHQAVVKLGRDLPEHAVNEWFRAVNRELGDERITGLRHPLRLAGFANRKPRHEGPDGQFPFVGVVEAVNRFCQRARVVVEHMAEQIAAQAPRRIRASAPAPEPRP